jgi:hypothetical protein
MFGERPGDDRLEGVGQHHVQPPRIAYLGFDVVVGGEGGGGIGDMLQPIT